MIPKLIVGKYIVLFLVYLNLSLLPWLILPRDQHGASQDGKQRRPSVVFALHQINCHEIF